jgi:phosphonatase-like hydrolase
MPLSLMQNISLVIFDMAGTTVRDDNQVPEAFTAALAEHGIAIEARQIQALRGASKKQAIAALLPPGADLAARTDRVYETFRVQLARRFDGAAREVPGAAAVFARLRGRGLKVALNTGFDRDTTRMLMRALGWNEAMVDAIACGDEVAQGRPAPDLIHRCMALVGISSPRAVANLGDTILDLRAGHAAGVALNIGVLSGAHPRDMLAAEPHTHLLASVADLPALLAAT